MKSRVLSMLLAPLLALGEEAADSPALPPQESRGEWKELQEKKFADWSIKGFHGWDLVFDGGSKVFSFEADNGERFAILAANRAYWSAVELKEHRQVFFVLHKGRFYRIEPGSKEEADVIAKLTQAAARLQGDGDRDPALLTELASRLKFREPLFKSKPR